MPKLPVVSGREIVKVLCKIGFEHVRTKGSHAILNKHTEKGKVTIPVPLHKELAKGTLSSILKQAEMTVEDLRNLL
ncbi:type II toxin-antitoxin system HicA family toxin [Candidatus Woesearchaeota archaeon]|nr:type II toxin-antitoxin system HicA family toxin [Candidatus Woesearchaeota archaeon]